jgi:hypothetical protein
MVLLFLLLAVGACKKNATTQPIKDETFFKVFPNISITPYQDQGNDYQNVFGIFTDAAGNLYSNCNYWDPADSAAYIACILKTDKYGNEIWHKKDTSINIGGSDGSNGLSCDGSNIYSQGLKQLVKWDTAGHVVLKVPFSQFLSPAVASVYSPGFTYAAGNNVLLSGLTNSYGSGGTIKGFSTITLLSSTGSLVWSLALPHDPQASTADGNTVTGVTSLADGSFLLASEAHRDYIGTNNFIDTNRIWIYRVDAKGQVIWCKKYGMYGVYGTSNAAVNYKIPRVFNISQGISIVVLEKFYFGLSISYTSVNSTFGGVGTPVGGPSLSSSAIELWKIDSAGNILDSAEISHEGYLYPTQAVKKSNGNIVIAAVSYKAIQSPFISILYEIGPDLKIVNTKSFGTPSESIFVSGVGQTPDGHIVGCGTIQSFGKDQNHLFTFKTDANEKY